VTFNFDYTEMKNKFKLLALLSVMATTAQAAPFLAVGDNAEIFLTGTLGVRADSNIFLTSNATSDTIFDIDPGLQLVFGNGSAVKGTWDFTENFSEYASHSGLNSSLASTSFTAGIEDGKSKGTVTASYNQLNQNTVDNTLHKDVLARRNVLAAGANGEVSATEKTSVGLGFQYEKTDYLLSGFNNDETATVPFNYYYEVTPKLDLSAGYRYRGTWVQGGEDSTDHFFNVGLRGELTPKLTGTVNVGVTERHFTHSPNASLLGIDSSFSYAVSPKATLQFGVSNDFDTNSQGQAEKNFAINGSGTVNLSEQWSVTGSLSYRVIDYLDTSPARTDDYFEGQISASYQVNSVVRITGAFAYRTNNSTLNGAGFDDNVLSLAANFRY